MLKRLFTALVVCGLMSPSAYANPTKEFIRSCTYGVLTGTLVGIASLAFEDQPGDNLQAVARGASLGLYLGIGLGMYVIYGVDDGVGEDEELLNEIEEEARMGPPKLMVYPMISNNRIDGIGAQLNLLTF